LVKKIQLIETSPEKAILKKMTIKTSLKMSLEMVLKKMDIKIRIIKMNQKKNLSIKMILK